MSADPRPPLLYHEHLEAGQQRVFAVDGILAAASTSCGQRVEIVDLHGFGPTLFIDGVRQSSAADEHVYHEILVHPALLSASRPVRRVLIAGGGEGATAREVLRHRDVTAVQVDLDPELVALCRTHLPAFSAGAYDDPRLELRIGDIRDHLAATDERYDAIVLDVPEWDGTPGIGELYTPAFHAALRRRLAPGGVITGQLGPVHPSRLEALAPFARLWAAAHPHLAFVVAPELGWVFGIASDRPFVPPPDDLGERLLSRPRYYSADLHRHLAYCPPHLAEALRQD